MIEISADAKMLLAENRKTLFKADLSFENGVSASGKNLNYCEDGYQGHIEKTILSGQYNTFDGYGCDFSHIPIGLLRNYRYLIISHYVRHNYISNDSLYSIGLKYRYKKSYIADTVYESRIPIVAGDFTRYITIFDLHDENRFRLRNADLLITTTGSYYRTPTYSDIDIDIDFKNAMFELNNTGIPSDYVNSFLVNGGSYADLGYMSLTGDDVMSNTVTFSDSTSSSGSFDIGAAIINGLSLTLNNYDDRFSLYDFTGAKIRPYIGIPLETTEWITKGYYTVDKPTSIGNTIPLTMLDNMSKFEKPYREVIQTFPATVSQILQTVCIYCGVVLDNTTFTNSTLSISSRPEDENLSCLDMVSAIAQLAGCYARINNQGYLQMMWYDTEAFNDDSEDYDGGTFLTNTTPYSDGDSLDGGDFSYDGTEDSADGGSFTYGDYFSCYAFSSFSVGTDDITITGIKVTVDSDNYYAVGEDGYVLEISNNPLITAENMESVAQFLGNKIIGMKFRPFNVSALSDPTVEAGDAIRLTDRKGNYYDSFVTSCSYKFGNYESFACNAESVSQRNATNYSPLTKVVEQARKDTQKALSSYDQAVVEMNNIALNSMGYYSSYTEELDGSRTSYIHNKPSRGESTILWKLSASGFFLSTNGGTTWVSGWDANGNAVYNILNAIGIRCDWIKAGILTLGGSDNVNGLMRVLNASGSEVVRADHTGLKAIGADITGKITASSGSIGGFDISNNTLSSYGHGMIGIKLETNTGKVSWSWNNSTGSYSSFRSGSSSAMPPNMVFWAGAANGIEGIYVTNSAYNEWGGMSSWIRHGSQQIESNDKGFVTWSGGSDARIKRDIIALENVQTRIFFEKVEPKIFKYTEEYRKGDDKTYFGVIAQDMEKIFDDLEVPINNIVTETDDNWKFVNYQEFHAFELAGIKDLYETIDKQQVEIDELKQQVKLIMEKAGG